MISMFGGKQRRKLERIIECQEEELAAARQLTSEMVEQRDIARHQKIIADQVYRDHRHIVREAKAARSMGPVAARADELQRLIKSVDASLPETGISAIVRNDIAMRIETYLEIAEGSEDAEAERSSLSSSLSEALATIERLRIDRDSLRQQLTEALDAEGAHHAHDQ